MRADITVGTGLVVSGETGADIGSIDSSAGDTVGADGGSFLGAGLAEGGEAGVALLAADGLS